MIAIGFFLRLGRWGVAGFAALSFISTYALTDAFYAIAGQTAKQRQAFGSSITELGAHFTAILPPPLHPEAVGGFVEWRSFHGLAILFAAWAFVSATAMVRVDEERGVIEALLASGVSRLRLVAARVIGYAIAATVASAAAAAGFLAAVRANGDSITPTGVAEASLLLGLLALCCYGLSLFIAQLLAARMATAGAAVVLIVLFLVESLSRTYGWLSTWRWLSPFHYYDLSQPLSPEGALDPRSITVLLGVSILATAATAWAFTRRDLGSPLVPVAVARRGPSYEPAGGVWWRIPVVRELYQRRIGLLVWCAGVVMLAVIFVLETKALIQPLLSIPSLIPYFGSIVRGNLYPSALGYAWLNVAELLFAGFAISQVARWAAEDTDGRLEAILSQPRSRGAVVVERMVMVIAGAVAMAGLSGIAVAYVSHSQGIDLDSQRVATASLLLVPFALVFAAVGGVLVAWNPRAAVGVLSGIAFLSFLDTEVGPFLKFPGWVLDLSAFKLYGTPLISGVDNRSLAIMLAIALAGIASSILAVQARDVGA